MQLLSWIPAGVRPLLVLGLFVANAHADSGRCVVAGRGVTLQEVTVKPPGAEPFQLGIDDLPVRAHIPDRCGAPLDLDVGGAIAFTASRDLVWLTVTRDITTTDGLIILKRGARMIDACMHGDRVIASAILENDDTLEGEHKPGDQVVKGVEVPCDALSLDSIELADDDIWMTGGEASDETAAVHVWELRGEASSVALRVQPNSQAASRLLESPSCIGCIQLLEIKCTKHWLLVETAGFGVRASGWVMRKLVKQLPDDVGISRSAMCTGDHGGGGGWGESPDPNSVQREATVRVGTAVYVGDGTSPWGTFTRDERVNVRITQGSPWAELRHVPGLDGDPSGSPWLHGQVRLDALKLDPTP